MVVVVVAEDRRRRVDDDDVQRRRRRQRRPAVVARPHHHRQRHVLAATGTGNTAAAADPHRQSAGSRSDAEPLGRGGGEARVGDLVRDPGVRSVVGVGGATDGDEQVPGTGRGGRQSGRRDVHGVVDRVGKDERRTVVVDVVDVDGDQRHVGPRAHLQSSIVVRGGPKETGLLFES